MQAICKEFSKSIPLLQKGHLILGKIFFLGNSSLLKSSLIIFCLVSSLFCFSSLVSYAARTGSSLNKKDFTDKKIRFVVVKLNRQIHVLVKLEFRSNFHSLLKIYHLQGQKHREFPAQKVYQLKLVYPF